MEVIPLELPGVLLFEPRVHRDARGRFAELWRQARYAQHGVKQSFVQDNVSVSARGVLRGLHFQSPNAQGKLVSVLQGRAFDVAVDVRAGSPAFGKWVGVELGSDNGRQVYIPPGFAHGFQALEDNTVVLYKCTEYYEQSAEMTLLWNDAQVGITWPLTQPLLSEKDAAGQRLHDIPSDRLPRYDASLVSTG